MGESFQHCLIAALAGRIYYGTIQLCAAGYQPWQHILGVAAYKLCVGYAVFGGAAVCIGYSLRHALYADYFFGVFSQHKGYGTYAAVNVRHTFTAIQVEEIQRVAVQYLCLNRVDLQKRRHGHLEAVAADCDGQSFAAP